MQKTYDFIKKSIQFIIKLTGDGVTAKAAQASFYLFLSFIPFLILLVSLVNYIPSIGDFINESSFSVLPDEVAVLLDSLIDEIQSSSTALVPVALIGTLWSASRGVYTIIYNVSHIYSNDKKMGYIATRLISLVYAFLYCAAIVISLVVLVFGSRISDFILRHYPLLKNLQLLNAGVRYLFLFAVLVLFFCTTYAFIAHKRGQRPQFSIHLPGALLSAAGWGIFSLGFSFFVDNFSNYAKVYGSLTAVILLLLWLQACMCIFFVGARLNVMLQERQNKQQQ